MGACLAASTVLIACETKVQNIGFGNKGGHTITKTVFMTGKAKKLTDIKAQKVSTTIMWDVAVKANGQDFGVVKAGDVSAMKEIKAKKLQIEEVRPVANEKGLFAYAIIKDMHSGLHFHKNGRVGSKVYVDLKRFGMSDEAQKEILAYYQNYTKSFPALQSQTQTFDFSFKDIKKIRAMKASKKAKTIKKKTRRKKQNKRRS